MQPKKTIITVLLILALGSAAMADAGAPASELVGTKKYRDWSTIYEKRGGDRFVAVTLASSTRGLSTEAVDARGFVELDLIGGWASVSLTGLDRAVDVYALDNKPGPAKSILAEAGDRLIHLARLTPAVDGGVAAAEKDLGPEVFRGFELDWVIVSEADQHPAKSRLLYGARSHLEVAYTRERLKKEGFTIDRDAPRTPQLPLKGGSIGTVATAPDPALVTLGLVSQDVFDGADVFFRETFEGNGRRCGTCHPAENNQTIEKEFIATLPPSDPLFVAEGNFLLSKLERPPLMREFGLILENVDDLSDPNVRFLMRSVPHSLSLATSALPGIFSDTSLFVERTGWSGDGSPAAGAPGVPPSGRLVDFLLGAITQHAPKSLNRVFKEDVLPGQRFDFRMPTQEELRVANEYMLEVGRKNELDLTVVAMTNTRAENGRVAFQREGALCNACHTNAGANSGFAFGNMNFDTRAEFLANPAQGHQGINFPLDGGFGGQGVPTPNNDCDGDGVNDCFGDLKFNTPPLIEAADTAPFFHNNTVATIEDSVEFYTGAPFFDPDAVPPNDREAPSDLVGGEIDDVGAFLRVLNASFNLSMSIQRTEAAIEIAGGTVISGTNLVATANKILLLSVAEIDDAVDVLTSGPLGNLDSTATTLAASARSHTIAATGPVKLSVRLDHLEKALEALTEAKAHLGTGMDFDLGTGNLLF